MAGPCVSDHWLRTPSENERSLLAPNRGAGARNYALESDMRRGEPIPQRRRVEVDDLDRRLPPLIEEVALLVSDSAAAQGRRMIGKDTRANSRVINAASRT